MACEQRLRTDQGTQLLPNVVVTEQQSLVVVKKLLAIAVSSITYLRGLFPEKAYGSKYVEEQKVMILREERSCPGASQIVQWMQGCFDALQRKYLRTVVLSIYTDPENPQKVTECYQFQIQYSDKGPLMDFKGKNNNNNKNINDSTVTRMASSNTKKASILLVRKLYTLMQNLGPLPDNVCLNMKLSYYDNVTPQDYQPPGFKEGDQDTMEFKKEPIKLTMGEVVTPFHTLKVDVTTEKERLEQVEEEPRDKWMIKMENEGTVSRITSEQSQVKGILCTQNPIDEQYLDNTDIQMSSCKTMEICEEITENSSMDSSVKRVLNIDMDVKKTRSGRVINSTKKEGQQMKQPTPDDDKIISQFEFPCSQEQSSVPKRRKFSEPKERY
ncbi:HORMA domain-containing protein 1 [Aplochiton taeniatus]